MPPAERSPGTVFNVAESSFNLVQGVTTQLAHATWYRGEHCNFNPTKEDLVQPDAIVRHITRGWMPRAPFITREHGITAFGSCFAENLTQHLAARSYRVLTDKRHASVTSSYVIRCAEGIVNTFAMRQQFEWAFEGARFDEDLWFDSRGALAPYNEEVRRETVEIFRRTDVFIITVGLAEVWYSVESGDVFWRAIPADRFDPRRHGFRLSSVAENVENLEAIRRIIRHHRPDASIVFTLSPIPLHATFRPVSCVTANAVSKATLRVALDELVRAHADDERLFYFPAYEIVREGFGDPYAADNRHLKPEVVRAVVTTFERGYCAEADAAAEPAAPAAQPIAPGIDAERAWTRSLETSACVWDPPLDSPHLLGSVRGRIATGYATPAVTPTFRLAETDAFFCIGSCFARVLERHLRYRNLAVTSMRFHSEPAEAAIGANAVNKFTTASMLNELRWSLAGDRFPDDALVPYRDGYCDLQLRAETSVVPLERARERRVELQEYFGRLRRADVVIITLGLVELWFDHVAGLWLNVTPPLEMTRRFPGRFTVHSTDYAQNRAQLTEALDLLAEHGPPGQRVILTVSPVPMHRTFVDADALTANAYGKSTLRAVAGDVARSRANVDYWPAYEMVTVGDATRTYEPDRSHVTDETGHHIVRAFAAAYGLRDDRPERDFHEKEYLAANADVLAAVAAGQFASGYDHWVMFGRAEGRPLRTLA